MSSYTKLVMIPMDVYNNIIGGASQQPKQKHEIATPPPQIPVNPPPLKNKKGIKRERVLKRRQYVNYYHQ